MNAIRPLPSAAPVAPERRAGTPLGPATTISIRSPAAVPVDVVDTRRSGAVPVDADAEAVARAPEAILTAMATWGSPSQARSAAARPNLPATAARAVLDRGDWEGLRVLAGNKTSLLPEDVMEGLLEASGYDTELGTALLGRKDLPPDAARMLATQLAKARSEDIARKGETSGYLPSEGRDKSGKTKEEAAAERVDVLAKLRPLRPGDIALCLSLGRVDEAMSVVAKLAGVPTPTAVRAFQNGDIAYAMNQMRALGLDDSTAGWLLRSVGRVLTDGPRPSQGAAAYQRTAALMSSPPSAPAPSGDGEAEEPYEPMDMRI